MTQTRTPFVALSLAALCLAACATEHPASGSAPLTPIDQYRLQAQAATDRLALAPHADGLSDAQAQALKALAAHRAEADGGAVTISLPHGAADAAAVARTADAAQLVLNVAGARVLRSTYESDDAKAPLLVSFDFEKAVVAHCGRWDDLTSTGGNGSYANFGCAVTANMAAQIANPSDIVRPRAEDAPDADRRTTILEKYRAGKVTSADEPEQKAVGAAIAHVGQ
jgi:pilus assembly protein CpaD